MSDHNDRMHHQGDSDPSPDAIEEFANDLDQSMRATADRVPDASALDPALWDRIQTEARPPNRQRSQASSGTTVPVTRNVPSAATSRNRTSATPSIPAATWHRGLAAFFVVALAIFMAVVLSESNPDPQYGAMLDAPDVATPAPIDTETCNVEQLTTDEVFEMVVNPEGTGEQGDRSLFTTPPPGDGEYPHTNTWLPEADGTVRVGDGTADVRPPSPEELQTLEASLNRYFRCQDEGTNFQLWSLESGVEIQRQIVQSLRQESLQVEITETKIIDEIERLGPLPRQDGSGQYMTFETGIDGASPDRYELQANPQDEDAFVTIDSIDGHPAYAWVGSQVLDTQTGEIVSTRGGALEPSEGDFTLDSVPPAPGAFVLQYHADQGTWLVEWFVPYI